VLDLDQLDAAPADFEAMEAQLTWKHLAREDREVGMLQDYVVRRFVGRGMPM